MNSREYPLLDELQVLDERIAKMCHGEGVQPVVIRHVAISLLDKQQKSCHLILVDLELAQNSQVIEHLMVKIIKWLGDGLNVEEYYTKLSPQLLLQLCRSEIHLVDSR